MKKVLLVNSSSHQNGCTWRALKEIQDQLAKDGVESDLLWLGNAPVADCIACGHCRGVKGECVFQDEVNKYGDLMGDVYGGIIAGSPVYYSGVSGRLGSFMDRLFYSHGKRMRGLIGAAVTSARRGGNTAAFERVNQYYLMSDMIVPGSQYWNIVHGFSPEDVEKDLEGLQTMRRLADNVAYLLKLQELGEANGITMKAREKATPTHFMDGK
ncbi:MAG: flavodoxin family protein [Bacilli bacterium]|nr:flavodoxin family protein [Bacilli bacterium]